MRKLILSIAVLVVLATAQVVLAFTPISWTDDEGTFVLDVNRSTWSFGAMSGSLSSVEQSDNVIFFEGGGDAGVFGYVFGDQGRAVLQTNTGTITVTGAVQ